MKDAKKNDPRRHPSSRQNEEAWRPSALPGADPRQKGESRPEREGADEDRDRARRDTGRQGEKADPSARNRKARAKRKSGGEIFKPFSRQPEGHSPGDEATERGGGQANRDVNLGGDSVKSSSEAPGREIIDERRRVRQTIPPGKI
jgi:hypothetical protein